MTATLKNRPTCKPPADPVHEFLANPMSRDDPVFITWLTHLERNGTPYTVGEDGKGKSMIYSHRVIGGETKSGGFWCCDGSRPEVRYGKRKTKI